MAEGAIIFICGCAVGYLLHPSTPRINLSTATQSVTKTIKNNIGLQEKAAFVMPNRQEEILKERPNSTLDDVIQN